MIELNDHYAVNITICGNAETLCDSYDITFREEAAAEACDAACDVIRKSLGEAPEVDSVFQHWNGGKFDNGRCDRFGWLAVTYYQRQDGELSLREESFVPSHLTAKVASACWAAHGAMQNVLLDNVENVS